MKRVTLSLGIMWQYLFFISNIVVLLQSTQSLGFYISRSNTQVGVEADGLEGLDTVPFEEPFTGLTLSDLSAIPYHSCSFFVFCFSFYSSTANLTDLQKYRLGQQSRKQSITENSGESLTLMQKLPESNDFKKFWHKW